MNIFIKKQERLKQIKKIKKILSYDEDNFYNWLLFVFDCDKEKYLKILNKEEKKLNKDNLVLFWCVFSIIGHLIINFTII